MNLLYLTLIFLCGNLFAQDAKITKEISSLIIGSNNWKTESLNITKADDEVEHLGDCVVVIKLRNTSNKSIKVASNRLHSQINRTQFTDDEFKKYLRIRYKIHHACCHPANYIEVLPNQIYTITYRESSQFEGKSIALSSELVQFGTYTLKTNK